MKEIIKKILREVEEEGENVDKLSFEDLPKETDPSKGIVAPSQKVISDVCEKEKFCRKQGPITFGQLRKLIETAQTKNLVYDIGEGFYKALIRLIPWFFPQIAVAGFVGSSMRAFNKIIRPGLEDTRGYKRWWGKTIMTVMDYVEGDIPHTDPISKIFFISDGLLHMMDRKFKLKFARYISELATSKPDSEPVPEYFVENELRNWINQKFLLNPPLQPKTINESLDNLNWIREIKPLSYDDLLGKALEFDPPIQDSNTLTSILNFLVNIGFEHGDWYLDMGEEAIIGLYINPYGRIIWSGDWVDEDYQEHINDYAETNVKILDGWDTLSDYVGSGTINESEDDLDWIRKTGKTPLHGLKLTTPLARSGKPMIVIDDGDREVTIRTHSNGDFKYDRRTVKAFIERGTWQIVKESEEDEWGWAKEIEIKSDLTPAQIYNKYEVFPVEVVGPYIAGQFRDIEYRNGKLYFITDGWCDFVEMFEDSSGSGYYINQYLAKAILCGDDYWEPYSASDLIGRVWKSSVWDVVTDIPQALEHVKKYIKKHYVVPVGYSYDPNQLELFDEPSKKLDVFEIDGRVLDTEFFDEIIQDNNYLGDLIDDEEIFEELKRELGWAYAGSYNSAVSNNIYESVTDTIIDLFGKPTWEGDKLVFESTSLILDMIESEISNCWSWFKKYYDPERHKGEDQTDEEAFSEFADECIDKPFDNHSWFLNLYSEFLREHNEELSPRYDEYASNSEIKEYFLDELYGRI